MKRFLSQNEGEKQIVQTIVAQENVSVERGDSTTNDSSGHAVVYNSKWEEEFPWILIVKYDTGIVTGMLYMMCDTMPRVSRLSRLFQLSTIDMSELHKHVLTTVESLNSFISNPEAGDNFRRLETDLKSTLAPYSIHHSPEATSMFLNNIQKPFLNALVENIKERLPDTNIFSNFEL